MKCLTFLSALSLLAVGCEAMTQNTVLLRRASAGGASGGGAAGGGGAGGAAGGAEASAAGAGGAAGGAGGGGAGGGGASAEGRGGGAEASAAGGGASAASAAAAGGGGAGGGGGAAGGASAGGGASAAGASAAGASAAAGGAAGGGAASAGAAASAASGGAAAAAGGASAAGASAAGGAGGAAGGGAAGGAASAAGGGGGAAGGGAAGGAGGGTAGGAAAGGAASAAGGGAAGGGAAGGGAAGGTAAAAGGASAAGGGTAAAGGGAGGAAAGGAAAGGTAAAGGGGGAGGAAAGGTAAAGGGGAAGGGAGGGAASAAGGVSEHRRSRRSWVWNQFFVLEEYAGDEPLYVGKLHSDVDKGDGQVRYVLNGEGATSIFTIDENTGDIHATKRLDREQQAYYTLRAQARDRETNLPVEPESQFVIKVQDINDNEPKFLDGPYTGRVAERAPVGTSVVTVAATDADDPTYGNSARLVYSILQGQPYFSVEPKTGVVRTALADMDREVQERYLLVVQAKDMIGQMGGLSGSTSVTVILTDVNDNPPRFPRKSYQFGVPESAPVSSVVAKIRALDLDVGSNAEMDYRILDGDGLGTFRILTDPITQEGLFTLQKSLDFETKSSYMLRVEASNRYVDAHFLTMGPFSDVATVRVLVENVDEPPIFSLAVSRMVISEAAAVGTDVGSVFAHDPDATKSPIRYAIDRKSDVECYFSIDSSSGLIVTARPLDRESIALHNITVLATETLDRSQVGKAVVLVSVTDVNDNAPTFAFDYETFVCENSEPGQIIETLSAVDPDEPENGHHFLFSLTAEAAGNLNFTLRDNKDNTASVLTRRGDFLQQDQLVHLLPVVISDGSSPSLSSTNTLSIIVCTCEDDGNRRSCGQRARSLLVVGLSAATTAAVLTSVLTLLGVVMVAAAVRRRRKEPLIMDDERDIRENIVRYDDEGGGEEDTEAFNMLALRHLNKTQRTHQDSGLLTKTPEHRTDKSRLVQEFIRDRLQEADLDLTAPPYDSLQTYAFEGSWSAAESLSSLNSYNSSEPEQSYDFLSGWGPKFRKLADLYGHHEGEGGAS